MKPVQKKYISYFTTYIVGFHLKVIVTFFNMYHMQNIILYIMCSTRKQTLSNNEHRVLLFGLDLPTAQNRPLITIKNQCVLKF